MPRRKKLAVAEGETAPVPAIFEDDPMSGILRKVARLGRTYGSERRRVDALRPNKYNANLFPDSLAPASIGLLAEDLEVRNLEVPVRTMPDGTIVNGERRWRAAKSLGWDEIDVVVGPMLSDAELLDNVIGACTSQRQMTVREQVNIWVAVSEQLKRDSGRTPGRPSSKAKPKGEGFLSPEEIAHIAAAKAGFDSIRTAERAVAVFTRGSAALQAKVLEGKLSISAAYKQVPKQARRARLVPPALIQAQVIRALPAAESSASNIEPSPHNHPVQSRLLTSGGPDADAPARPMLLSGDDAAIESSRLEAPGSLDDEGVECSEEKEATDEQPDPTSEPEPAASASGADGTATGHPRVPVEPVEIERAFDRARASLIDLIHSDPEAVKAIVGRVRRALRKIEKVLP